MSQFDVIMLPEVSCRWRISEAMHHGQRKYHPFLVMRMARGRIVGLVVTTLADSTQFVKVELPVFEPRRMSWITEHFSRKCYVMIDPWYLRFGELLFDGEEKPRKLGYLLDAEIRNRVQTAIVSQVDG